MFDSQPATVYAVRHGETEWNLVGKQQGHLDSPLTDRGIQQAKALCAGLAGRGIEKIYSSDLGRALDTAKIVGNSLALPVLQEQRLRERHLGSLQGLTKEEWRSQYPEEWVSFSSGDPDYCFPGGESARQRLGRTVACIEERAKENTGRTILIVAHGGVLSGLFYRSTGLPLSEPRHFSLFNAAINSFTVSTGTWRLDTWGETVHLRGIETLDDN